MLLTTRTTSARYSYFNELAVSGFTNADDSQDPQRAGAAQSRYVQPDASTVSLNYCIASLILGIEPSRSAQVCRDIKSVYQKYQALFPTYSNGERCAPNLVATSGN